MVALTGNKISKSPVAFATWRLLVVLHFVLEDLWWYNTNQWNAQFSKLVFNFYYVLLVSYVVGLSSARQLYILYGMLYILRCEQPGV